MPEPGISKRNLSGNECQLLVYTQGCLILNELYHILRENTRLREINEAKINYELILTGERNMTLY